MADEGEEGGAMRKLGLLLVVIAAACGGGSDRMTTGHCVRNPDGSYTMRP